MRHGRGLSRTIPPRSRMPAAESVRSALAGAGLRLEREEEECTSPRSIGPAMMCQLQALGVTGGALSRGSRSLTRHQMCRLLAYYDAHFHDAVG